jgi:thymidylate kinase
MIVELFGPPCVGKTTLASAVATRLREGGRGAELVLSYRPSERPPGSAAGVARLRPPAALSRLVRPIIESFAALGHSADAGDTGAAAELMRLLAPKNVVYSLRVRQYLLRLARTWRAAAATGDIALFDQGFVQAIGTCAVLTRAADPQRIGLALDAAPEADLFVRLDAPVAILETRLAERQQRQGRIERLFDAWTKLESLWIFDHLHELLRARGRPVVCVDSADRLSLGEGVDRVEAVIVGARTQGKVLAKPDLGRDGAGC